jgi:hypothetical protein
MKFVEVQMCPEWCKGFLLVDGTMFPFFQCPRLHGDAWYDKGGVYSINCQVRHDINHKQRLSSLFTVACYTPP